VGSLSLLACRGTSGPPKCSAFIARHGCLRTGSIAPAIIPQPPIPKTGKFRSRKSSWPVSSQKNMRQVGWTRSCRSISLRITRPAHLRSLRKRPPPRLGDRYACDLDRASPPATTRWLCAVASPARTRSTICRTEKPCARHIASVQPSREAASNSSARWRSGWGPWRRPVPDTTTPDRIVECFRRTDASAPPAESLPTSKFFLQKRLSQKSLPPL